MVHTFERAGLRLALDTGSGAVHLMSAPAFALLQMFSEDFFAKELQRPAFGEELTAIYGGEELLSAHEELCSLVREGLLFSDDSYSEFKPMLGDAPIKAMCLHVAHDCNLRCKYCFACTGDFGVGRKLMPFETAKKAIDFLVAASGKRRNLEVDFFGGEPLMNFGVVENTVAYARSLEKEAGKHFRFTVTTNGLMLNAKNMEFINREMDNVVLSIDGRREVNDRMRIRVDGSGSYDAIVPKFRQLVETRGGKEYYVRGTYTKYNLDFDQDVLELNGLGFDQISVEPVVGPSTDDYAIQEEHVAQIEQGYVRLMNTMARRRKSKSENFNFFHFMLDLNNGPCAIKRLRGCGSGNEYVAITPEGDIYPCHQFVGNSDFIMGHVDQGITRPELKARFADAHVLNKPACEGCWAKFFCSGGCNANNHSFNGNILEPHALSCQLEKIRLECAITLQALQSF